MKIVPQTVKIESINDVAPEVIQACRSANVTDANETMVLARQMEIVKQKVLEKKYPEMIGRSLVPPSPDGDNASQFYVVRYWDEFTMAKVVVNYATDFPLVGMVMSESYAKFFSIGNAFQYSIQDLREAAKAGVDVSARKAQIARDGIERAIDDIVFRGVPANGSYGLMNQPNVPVFTFPTGNWASATGQQILDDLMAWVQSVVNATNEALPPNTIVLDAPTYGYLSTKIVGLNLNETVLSVFKKINPYITTVAKSVKLNTLDSAGTGPRAICYRRDPDVLEFVMGQEFEMFPGDQEAMVITTACHARIGGVNVFHPLALSYAESHA